MAILSSSSFKLPTTDFAKSVASGFDLGSVPVTQTRKVPSTGLAGQQRSVTETVPLRESNRGFVEPRPTQTAPQAPLPVAQPAPVSSQMSPQTVTLPNGREVTVDQTGNITSGVPTFAVDTAQITPNISAPVVQTAVTDRPTQSDILSPIMAQQEEIQRLQQEAIRLSQPTDLETQTLQQIRDFDLETMRQDAISEARRAPTFAIRGEQAEIQRQSAIQRNALTNQLQALTDSRTGMANMLQTSLGFSQQNLENIVQIGEILEKQLQKPEGNFEASRQAAVLGVISSGITSPQEIFQMINFDEQGNQVGDISLDEITDVLAAVAGEEDDVPTPSGTQFQAATFSSRASQADNVINEIGADFTGALELGRFAPNFLKSSDRQRFEQAQRNFVNAILRRESGANITDTEFESAQLQYFPQPGDSPEVIQQKSQNRRTVIQGLRDEAGSALRQENSSFSEVVIQASQRFPNATDEELADIALEAWREIHGGNFKQVGGDTKQASNVPQRNNNPGNIKAGGLADTLAIGTDEQGHLIFPDADAGFEALERDLRAKISGNSRFLPANPTLAELGKVYAEDPNWTNSVASILGVSPDTRTGNINFVSLLQAIARQEGFYA